ncbi:MAG: hypothetical protein LC632_05250 [Xanthomonadaceae bacterium]|nr:hypothetical protein [Xanthomonadaceae bacterium]
MYSPEKAEAAAGALMREKQKAFEARIARPTHASDSVQVRGPRVLMGLSALMMAVIGLAATFAPGELLAAVGADVGAWSKLLVQLAGALYLGFGMVNWMARGSLIGGIYGRPVATGNLVHFVVMAFALSRAALVEPAPALVVAAVVYGAFALWFAFVAFTSPLPKQAR